MGSVPSHNERSNPETKVYQASRDGRATYLDEVLKALRGKERKRALETKHKDGDDFMTPLIIAARNGNLDVVEILLSYGADIEARGIVKIDDEVLDGLTPLWGATTAGHIDVLKLLIEKKAEVDGKLRTGSTPLRCAAYNGRLDIVSYLVENGADVNACKNDETSPLFPACSNGHTNVVEFLIKHGANVNVQDKNGNTALHDAAKQGHNKIANKLLSHGALQLQNVHGLTPLLLSSNHCKIKLVEYFIERPECTKEQRIDALELLGATIANDPEHYDIKKAFCYLKRGLDERFKDRLHPLLKRQMDPLEVYENRKESQTLEELVLLKGDDHAIHMEGLMIRERILGTDNTMLRTPIRYRGAEFANSGDFNPCVSLWCHALKITRRCNKSAIEDLENLASLFAQILSEKRVFNIKFIEEVFEQLVLEFERLTEELEVGKYQIKLKDAIAMEEELERLTYCALYLLMMRTKVTQPKNDERLRSLDFLKRLINLHPCDRDGDTLLHLAASYITAVTDLNVRSVCKFPCVKTMTLLLLGGFDVNAVNSKGDTPLHVAVAFKPSSKETDTLKAMLQLLLNSGADPRLENTDGLTAIDYCTTEDARVILSNLSGVDIMTIESRATESPCSCSQDPLGQPTIICQSDAVKVTVLANNWCLPFTAFSYLTKEFAFHLAKHPRVKVSLLVPDNLLSEEDKREADMTGISIVEAKAHPGFPDPVDWLCFPPREFSTDVVVALDDNLGKIAHVLREHRSSGKRIQMVYSLNTGRLSSRFYSFSKESAKSSSSRRKHQTNIGMCESADLVVGLGSKLADELTASLRYFKKQVLNLTPGIFSKLSDLIHAEEDGIYFRILVLSGSDSTEFFNDRFHITAKAISSLRDKTFHLVFIGVAEDKRSELLKKCCECNVTEQQVIMKDFPAIEEDLKRLFCEVDLAILLSAEDECGLMALCALSAGLPLYACGDSAFAASLRKVQCGTASIIDSEDAERWANSIKKVRELDRRTRLEQAEFLRFTFEEMYDWKKQVDILVERILDMFQGD